MLGRDLEDDDNPDCPYCPWSVCTCLEEEEGDNPTLNEQHSDSDSYLDDVDELLNDSMGG